jgi:predicted extracellular nuclease
MWINTKMTINKSTWLAMTLLASSQGAVAADKSICMAKATPISQIQGVKDSSPLEGKFVTVKALVSAVMPGLGGYYLLEEQEQWDDNNLSSEGLFVSDSDHKPSVGDRVVIKAKVSETQEFTQLDDISAYEVCAQGFQVAPVSLSFPLQHSLEAVEGMPVTIGQTMTISDNYGLARFGQMMLSNGRLFQPTNLARPGIEADKIAALNKANQIYLDDGSDAQNPDVVYTTDHQYRVGNTVSGVTGMVHYSFGKYLIEPILEATFHQSNKREPMPMVKQRGNLRIASFNVLNYFNGEGKGKKFPTQRGASTEAEFQRQSAKIVAAMAAIKADVLGLMEVENDGFGEDSAIVSLTNHLRQVTGVNYRFIRPDADKLGDGRIAVGMIYNADRVELAGKAVTFAEAPFNFKSRQPLAQTFTHKQSAEQLTVVVNHFKSKGSCPKDKKDLNANQSDGQACWNLLRTLSAEKLLAWMATHPTGSDDKDVLIIGDLNANAKEDPIIAIEQHGFTNLIERHQGNKAYSFVYRGESGYLDHALASKSLTAKVVDTIEWHINADEMRLTDYNLENKTPKQQLRLYKSDPFRSSDHDPVIIEVNF